MCGAETAVIPTVHDLRELDNIFYELEVRGTNLGSGGRTTDDQLISVCDKIPEKWNESR